jgi:hypothetical protein
MAMFVKKTHDSTLLKETVMKKVRYLSLVFIVGGLLSCQTLQQEKKSMPQGVEIKVDLKRPLTKNFSGVGVQWDPYEWYDLTVEQEKLVEKRVDHLQPAFIRTMIRGYFYTKGFNKKNEPQFDFETERMKKLYKVLDYAEAHKIDVMLGEWDEPAFQQNDVVSKENKIRSLNIHEDDPRWSQMIAGLLKHLTTQKKYTVIKWYNYINEPNGDWSGCADFPKWKKGITHLTAALKKAGLSDKIRIAGPDASGDVNWIKLTVDEASNLVGAYDFHWYVLTEDVLSGNIEKKMAQQWEYIKKHDPKAEDKGFLMGEAGLFSGRTNGDQQPGVKTFDYGVTMADYAVQAMRAGMTGISAWDLDDALHINAGTKGITGDTYTTPPNQDTLKVWGFWNSLGIEMGDPADRNIRPWYFTWSLMSRNIKKGSTIFAPAATDETDIRSIASLTPTAAGNDLTLVLVNPSNKPWQTKVVIPGLKGISSLQLFNFFENDRVVDQDGFPKPARSLKDVDLGRGVEVALPERGVVILTSRG